MAALFNIVRVDRRCRRFALLVLTAIAFGPQSALATLTQSFSPSTIGPGSASRLVFTIDNDVGTALTSLTLSNTLPAGVTLATAPLARNSCGGVVVASPGADSIAFSGGRLTLGESCELSVYVVSSAVGSHINVSSDLTSDAGNHGNSSATLTVDAGRPGFSKVYSPASTHWRDRVRLTYTIDNSLSGTAINASGTFTDTLPMGLTVADPSNLTTDCSSSSLSAQPGGRSISARSITVNANSVCTISLDVFADDAGTFGHASSDFTSFAVNAGPSVAGLEVVADVVNLSQRFATNPVAPGAAGNLDIRITNSSRSESASGLSFSIDFDAALTGLAASGLPQSGVCGASSTLSGGSVVSLSGGSLAPGASCEFTIAVLVPAGAVNGSYVSTTGQLNGQLGATPFISAQATDTLQVLALPLLTKNFSAAAVGSGHSITVTYTLQNTGATDALTGFALTEGYGDLLGTAPVVPSPGSCGAGSSFTGVPPFSSSDPARLIAGGLSVPAGSSCSFDVVLPITAGMRSGRFGTNTESAAGQLGADTVEARIVEDDFAVIAPPQLALVPAEAFVVAGATTALDVTISNDSRGQIDADEYDDFSRLAFTLDLDSVLSGLSATGLPDSGVCGSGSTLSGSSLLNFSNGALAPGTNCVFSIELAVPAAATSGSYVLTTSTISGLARGITTLGAPASASLNVGGLAISQDFLDDPVAPGNNVTLRYTLSNRSLTEAATGIVLQQNFGKVLSGLSASALPGGSVCGAGSTLSGTTALNLNGGSLLPGESCSFDVTLAVPAGTPPSNYLSATDLVRAVFSGRLVVFPNASDILKVETVGAPRDLSPVNIGETDPDGDGIATVDEQAVGDGNGDGVADALQAHVASIISPITGRAVTLGINEDCRILSFTMVGAASLAATDGNAVYPEGLASFELECDEADVTLWFPGAAFSAGMTVRKFGPIAPNFVGPSVWYRVPSGIVDAGARQVRFNVGDGAVGDSTGIDGRIVDPVGPAVLPSAQAIPALSDLMLAVMALAFLVLGLQAQRRRLE